MAVTFISKGIQKKENHPYTIGVGGGGEYKGNGPTKGSLILETSVVGGRETVS